MATNRLWHTAMQLATVRGFNHPRLGLQLQRNPCLLRSYTTTRVARADSSHLRPLVLEKPDKFRPPSHPSRKPGPKRNFGPRLSDEQLEAQQTKQYPHMMPPEGSFKHKLLTSKGFHLWLSLSILATLAFGTFYMDFHSKNHYPDLVPPGSLFWSHPFEYVSQYATVYRMNTAANTAENMAKKQRKADEARKRREYMRAHGVEQEGPFGLGTVEGDEFRKQRQEEREKMTLEEQAREQLARELRVQRERERAALEGGEVRGFDGEAKKAKGWFW